jgi:hypothetical protein
MKEIGSVLKLTKLEYHKAFVLSLVLPKHTVLLPIFNLTRSLFISTNRD